MLSFVAMFDIIITEKNFIKKVKNMYLNITSRAGNRKYLSIVHGYRDENGKVRKKTIQSLGYLDELEKEYEDPILHFKAVAKEMDVQRKQKTAGYSLCLHKQEELSLGTDNTKNFGYAALSKIYHELKLNSFLKNRQRHIENRFDANAILQALVYLKIISPDSDKSFFRNRNLLFEKSSETRDEFYQGLLFLYHLKPDLHKWINEQIERNGMRDNTMVYYNIQNYCSPSHVIRVGMFTDRALMPVTYDLFPCTSNYTSAFRPNFPEIKKHFNMKRMITVSNKAINNGDNIWKILNTPTNDGYIFNMPAHSADCELKQYILDDDGYEWIGEDYKRKSRIYSRLINITLEDGRTMSKVIEEKQVIFYSEKYAKRAKDSVFDGYYILLTSECEENDDAIIEMYRGLWEAESAFHLTKQQLETRPSCISVHNYIEINLLSCFVAMVLMKILQRKTNNQYSVTQLKDAMLRANCTHIQENLYLFSYYDKVLQTLTEVTGVPFDRKILPLGEIKQLLANTKK